MYSAPFLVEDKRRKIFFFLQMFFFMVARTKVEVNENNQSVFPDYAFTLSSKL